MEKIKTFKTEREYLWYLQGLKDAKRDVNKYLKICIERYEDGLQFTDFTN